MVNCNTTSVFHVLKDDPGNWTGKIVYMDTCFVMLNYGHSGTRFDLDETKNFSTFLVGADALMIASKWVEHELRTGIESYHISQARDPQNTSTQEYAKKVLRRHPGLISAAYNDFVLLRDKLISNPSVLLIGNTCNESDMDDLVKKGELRTADALHYAIAKHNSSGGLVTYDRDFLNVTETSVQIILGTEAYVKSCVYNNTPIERSLLDYYLINKKKLGESPFAKALNYTIFKAET